MITANLHNVSSISMKDLYPANLGDTISTKFADKDGNAFTIFLDDASLRELAIEMQRYAQVREHPPVEPKPSYAQALFAPVPAPEISMPDSEIPF